MSHWRLCEPCWRERYGSPEPAQLTLDNENGRIGELVREGQRNGTIRTQADGGRPKSSIAPVGMKIGTDEIFTAGHKERGDVYVMADAPPGALA
jgi:hypothetical protein